MAYRTTEYIVHGNFLCIKVVGKIVVVCKNVKFNIYKINFKKVVIHKYLKKPKKIKIRRYPFSKKIFSYILTPLPIRMYNCAFVQCLIILLSTFIGRSPLILSCTVYTLIFQRAMIFNILYLLRKIEKINNIIR